LRFIRMFEGHWVLKVLRWFSTISSLPAPNTHQLETFDVKSYHYLESKSWLLCQNPCPYATRNNKTIFDPVERAHLHLKSLLYPKHLAKKMKTEFWRNGRWTRQQYAS
jgi:hypothetical protein